MDPRTDALIRQAQGAINAAATGGAVLPELVGPWNGSARAMTLPVAGTYLFTFACSAEIAAAGLGSVKCLINSVWVRTLTHYFSQAGVHYALTPQSHIQSMAAGDCTVGLQTDNTQSDGNMRGCITAVRVG